MFADIFTLNYASEYR